MLAAGLGALLAALLLAVAGLWWWSGTQSSLEWALKQAPPGLVAEGAQGVLRTGARFQRLAWEQEGLKAQATGVDLAWQPLALLGGTLKLDHLRAASLRIEDARPPSADPPKPPVALHLPLRVAVDVVAIDQLQWVAASSFEAAKLAGRYVFDGAQHRLQLDQLDMAGGSYQGRATLGARDALPLDAMLEGRIRTNVPGGSQALPLVFSATVKGPLADLQARMLVHSVAGTTSTSATTATTAAADVQATVTAQVTAWAAQPVPQARAELRQLDLGALWPQAPRTGLAGELRLQPSGSGTWAVTADLRNSLSGPWDRERLPVDRLRGEGEWRMAGQGVLRSLEAQLGEGRVRATGQWNGAQAWSVESVLSGIDPAALHTAMAALPVGGRADASAKGEGIAFDVDLQAQGGVRPARAGAAPDEITAGLRALELRQALARGVWEKGKLSLPTLQVRTADAQLEGALELQPAAKAGSGHLSLKAPGLQAHVDGAIAESSGAGTLQLQANDLGSAQRWLQRLPGMPAALREMSAGGRGEVQLAWQGGWRDPAVQGQATVPTLAWNRAGGPGATGAAGAASGWTAREIRVSVNGRLRDAKVEARGQASAGQRRLALEFAGRGGRSGSTPAAWQGQLAALNATASDPALGTGSWTLALRRPLDLRWAGGTLDAGASEATLAAPNRAGTPSGAATPAVLAWDPVHWGGGQLRTAGRLSGLPMAWVELAGGPQLAGSALSGDMVFEGRWDANFGQALQLRASLARTAGDITVMAEATDGAPARVRAGVREARLDLQSEGDAVTLVLKWDSERAGNVQGRLATRLTPGSAAGWEWPAGAPLTGAVKAQLPRVGVWSLLAPPGWRLRGSLGADVAVSGTRGDPQFNGALVADDLALRSVVDGVELQDGRLRARLDGRRLVIDEFVLHGASAEAAGGALRSAGGTLRASGEGRWTGKGVEVRMAAQVERLRASLRADRQLTVSGQANAQVDGEGVRIDGKLKVDQAFFTIPEEAPPRLGNDVVVRRASGSVGAGSGPKVSEPVPAAGGKKLALAVDLDLGDDFRVRGRGIDTRLRGTLTLTAQTITEPRLNGVITTSGGEYRSYGQRLDVERGVLRFTGPADNPALDILAIRPNMVQRVGVQITGRAQAPFVRLYAEPELSEAEKLSWLVLGRSSASGGAEAALVQQAAMALLASRSGGSGKGLAAAVGLDELSFRRDGADGPAVTLGKRFATNFYAAYERSLSGAMGTLFVFYDLSRRVTVRGQAGDRTAVDLIFTFSYN